MRNAARRRTLVHLISDQRLPTAHVGDLMHVAYRSPSTRWGMHDGIVGTQVAIPLGLSSVVPVTRPAPARHKGSTEEDTPASMRKHGYRHVPRMRRRTSRRLHENKSPILTTRLQLLFHVQYVRNRSRSAFPNDEFAWIVQWFHAPLRHGRPERIPTGTNPDLLHCFHSVVSMSCIIERQVNDKSRKLLR